MRSKRIVSASWTIGALGHDPEKCEGVSEKVMPKPRIESAMMIQPKSRRALMVLSAGYDPASAPYQRAILPLNEESMKLELPERNRTPDIGATRAAVCH